MSAALLIALAAPACGTQPVSPSAHPQFAVLQDNGPTRSTVWNTVVVADLNGKRGATSGFTPMPTPFVGCAGAVLPTQAYVAAGRVFFADGEGVIRSLSPDGRVSTVTALPLTSSQQMLSFAISPDGKRVLGSIFTMPPKPDRLPNCGQETYPFRGPYTLDVFAAEAGSPVRLLYHDELTVTDPNVGPKVTAFMGWDAIGPLATYPTLWATQGGGPTRYFGIPARVDASTGRVTGPVTDRPSCMVMDIAASGDFLCNDLGLDTMTVLRPDGGEVWHVAAPHMDYALGVLSPDESRIALMGARDEVVSRDGTRLSIPPYYIAGWLDAQTVVGWPEGDKLHCVSLTGPPTDVDMGIQGLFVGAIRG